jgi:hypothetical protein
MMDKSAHELQSLLAEAEEAGKRTLRRVNLLVFLPAFLGALFLAFTAWKIANLKTEQAGLDKKVTDLRIEKEDLESRIAGYRSLLGTLSKEETETAWVKANASKDSDVREAVKDLAGKVPLPTPVTEDPPSSASKAAIYIQYSPSFGAEKTQDAFRALRSNPSWEVKRPQNVSYGPRHNDVRFYDLNDQPTAEKVIATLNRVGIDAKLNDRLMASRSHRRGVIEVWLTSVTGAAEVFVTTPVAERHPADPPAQQDSAIQPADPAVPSQQTQGDRNKLKAPALEQGSDVPVQQRIAPAREQNTDRRRDR